MSEPSDLPIILVSAKTEDAANQFINELIDERPPEGGAGVWRIVNKYYRADVRLLPHADGAPPPPQPPEGHVIYLAEDEMCEIAGESRLGAGLAAQVRVAAGARVEPAWAARRRLEPARGPAAARAALHAHVWPGLQRLPPPPPPAPAPPVDADGGSDAEPEWGEWVSGDTRAEERRAAEWAAALRALPGVRALQGAERRAAAEALLATVCRALEDDF